MTKIDQERLDSQFLSASVHRRSLHLEGSSIVDEFCECTCIKGAEGERVGDFPCYVLRIVKLISCYLMHVVPYL